MALFAVNALNEISPSIEADGTVIPKETAKQFVKRYHDRLIKIRDLLGKNRFQDLDIIPDQEPYLMVISEADIQKIKTTPGYISMGITFGLTVNDTLTIMLVALDSSGKMLFPENGLVEDIGQCCPGWNTLEDKFTNVNSKIGV